MASVLCFWAYFASFSIKFVQFFCIQRNRSPFPPFGSFKCPFSHKKTLPSCYFFSFARVALFLLTVFMVMVMVMYVFHFIVVASQALSRFFVFFLKRKKKFFSFFKKKLAKVTQKVSLAFFSFGKSLFCLSIVQHIYCSFFCVTLRYVGFFSIISDVYGM